MGLIDLLDPNLIACTPDLDDKNAVLSEIAGLAAANTAMDGVPQHLIYNALKQREELGSTGFGNGIAVPHCRLSEAVGFTVGLITVPEGVDFDSIDSEKAYIFPFVVGPLDKPKEHLKLLSGFSQVLRDSDLRKALLAESSSERILDLLKKRIQPEKDVPLRRSGVKMLHVFVRDEDIFDELLQVFAATETISAMVIEAHESSEYLSSVPLFASFWNPNVRQFNRIIIATVRDELANSTVRNIEYVCGKLSDRDDVMVTVTDLHYVLGSIDN
jgi:PTS system nitrogen regulatory IIA component